MLETVEGGFCFAGGAGGVGGAGGAGGAGGDVPWATMYAGGCGG